MKRKKNGFTLVELLVSVVILGIILGFSIPTIRNVQKTNKNKKFQTYERSLIDSAKLYTDSYSADMFGNSTYGCIEVPYSDLAKKTLIQDIQMSDSTCRGEKTYVRIIKLNDKYKYETHVECTSEKSNNVLFSSNKIEGTSMACNGVPESAGPTITFLPSQAPDVKASNNTKDKSVNVQVSSEYGIAKDSKFYYAWSTDENGADINTLSWKEKKIGNDDLEKIHYEKTFQLKTDNLLGTGDWYLFIRTTDNNGYSTLKDAANNVNEKTLYRGGIYVVDKQAPDISKLTVSSADSWNGVNIKVNPNGSKDNVNGENIKLCLKQGAGTCEKDDYVDMNKATLKLTGVTFNGATVSIKVSAKDLSENETSRTIPYTLYQECQTANLVKTTLKANGTCSKSCGSGTRTDVYNTKDKNSNNACAGKTLDTPNVACNTQTCCSSTTPTYGAWSSWGACSKSCGSGTQTRTRTVTNKSVYDGSTCSTSTETGSQTCNTQTCCSATTPTYGAWSAWGTCSKVCGSGTQTRKRTVTQKSNYDGSTCSTSTETGSQSCNTQSCCSSTTPSYGAWSAWGSCSKSCGSGTQIRTRTVTNKSTYDGSTCSTSTGSESQSCNTQTCCSSTTSTTTYGSWSGWSSCSKTCGGGTQTHTRSKTVTTKSTYDGSTCSTTTTTESGSQACNTQSCAPTISCCKKGSYSGVWKVTNSVKSRAYKWVLGADEHSGTCGNVTTCATGYGDITNNTDTYLKWTWSRGYFVKMKTSGIAKGTSTASNSCTVTSSTSSC